MSIVIYLKDLITSFSKFQFRDRAYPEARSSAEIALGKTSEA